MTILAKDVHARRMNDSEYARAYEESGPAMALAFAMADARARSGLSQAEVATAMKTSQGRISRWERGSERPTTVSLEKFAAATGARLEVRLIPAEAPTAVAARTVTPRAARRESPTHRSRAGS